MARQPLTSDEELYRMAAEVEQTDGKLTIARLREAAGGGSHARLKHIIDRYSEYKKRLEKQVGDQLTAAADGMRDVNQGSSEEKPRGRGRGRPRRPSRPAKGETRARGGRTQAATRGRAVKAIEASEQPVETSAQSRAEEGLVAREAADAVPQERIREGRDQMGLAEGVSRRPELDQDTAPVAPAPAQPPAETPSPMTELDRVRLVARLEAFEQENRRLWNLVDQMASRRDGGAAMGERLIERQNRLMDALTRMFDAFICQTQGELESLRSDMDAARVESQRQNRRGEGQSETSHD